MSSLVTRPWVPVPWTSSRLTPSLAAMLRTSGLENLRSRSSKPASPASISWACADSPASRWTSSFSSATVACAGGAAGWGCGSGEAACGAGAPSRAVSSRCTSVGVGCGSAPGVAAGTAGAAAAAPAPGAAPAADCSPASPIVATT